MSKRVTMSEVGRLAGVSQATVSLVINNIPNARISSEARTRVLAAAKQLGYRKGRLHALPKGGARVIALLMDEVATTPFGAPFIEGAQDEAASQDVVVATFCTRNDPNLEAAALEMVTRLHVTGVIYGSLITRAVSVPEALAHVPTVLLNCYERKNNHPTIIPGDVAGGHAATEALLKAGHRRIAHLKGEGWTDAAQARENGFRQALSTWDVPVDNELVISGGWTVDGGRELTHRLLDLPQPPTAIFCFNDRMALGAYEAVQERGLSVPKDISIVGFDDEDFAGTIRPGLSTVTLPHDEMARWAVNVLLEHVVGPPDARHGRITKFECSFVPRDSIASPIGL